MTKDQFKTTNKLLEESLKRIAFIIKDLEESGAFTFLEMSDKACLYTHYIFDAVMARKSIDKMLEGMSTGKLSMDFSEQLCKELSGRIDDIFQSCTGIDPCRGKKTFK